MTWIKMIFWIPLHFLEDDPSLREQVARLESETEMEHLGIAVSSFEPEEALCHPAVRLLVQQGKRAVVCHMPENMEAIKDDSLPALCELKPGSDLFSTVERHKCCFQVITCTI